MSKRATQMYRKGTTHSIRDIRKVDESRLLLLELIDQFNLSVLSEIFT